MADQLLLEKMKVLSSLVGKTPLKFLSFEGIKLIAKLEFLNPSGSLKDRPAAYILHEAIKHNQIDKDTLIVESSSGNFASSIATLCRELKLKFTPIIDPNITSVYEKFLHLTCDSVVKVTDRDETGGFLLTRLLAVKSICKSTKNSFWPNQYGNPNSMWAHYYGIGEELVFDLPILDYIFIGVSSGGTIAGVSRRIKEVFPNCKVIAVDIEGSVIFGGAPHKRHIPGIGASGYRWSTALGDGRNGEINREGNVTFSKKELDCMEILLKKYEGKTDKQKNPFKKKTLAWCSWIIARIGGWKGYTKSEGPPGPTTFNSD